MFYFQLQIIILHITSLYTELSRQITRTGNYSSVTNALRLVMYLFFFMIIFFNTLNSKASMTHER